MQVAAPFQLEPKQGRQHVIERMQHLNDAQRPYQRICIFMTMFFFRKDSVNLNPASTQYHTPRVTIRPCHRARRFPMQSASFENATRAVHKNLFSRFKFASLFFERFPHGKAGSWRRLPKSSTRLSETNTFTCTILYASHDLYISCRP